MPWTLRAAARCSNSAGRSRSGLSSNTSHRQSDDTERQRAVAVDSNANALVEDLFRREFGRLVSALTRLLGPAHVSLAEDVVQEALMTAMDAWRFESPRDPKAWILQVAKRR